MRALVQVGLGGMAAALSMSLVNYFLRFVRWQMYLTALGHRLPWLANGRLYLAGFVLTTTPGKAGEAIRGVFLRRWGVEYTTSVAALLSERLADTAAIVFLALVGRSFYPEAGAIVAAGVVVVGLAVLVLSQEKLLRHLHERTRTGRGKLVLWGRHVVYTLLEARRCHRPRLLIVATILSVLAWSAEGLAFHWILRWLGADYPLAFSVFVYAVSVLVGALSLLPGGVGGAEAVMVGLLVWKQLALPQAVAATVLIRLATLWFAVALGIFALLLDRAGRCSPAAA